MGLFKRKNKMTVEQYAYYNLYIISSGADNFFKNNKENIKFDIQSEILYYTYFTYVCEVILLTKYSEDTVRKVVEKIISRISDLQYEDCEPKTEETRETIKNLYEDYYNELKTKQFNFRENSDLMDMAKCFLKNLEINTYDAILVMNICMEITAFIKYHTQDILRKDIILMEE